MNRQQAAPLIAMIDFGSVRVGDWLPSVEFRVDAAAATRYAAATANGTDSPPIAPPLALVALALAAMTELMPLPPSTIHVGQDVDFSAGVAIGSVVRAGFRLDWRRCARDQVVSSFSFELAVGRERCAHGRVLLRTGAADLEAYALAEGGPAT
ncbi:MAG: hypothetical protein AB7U23_02955 [Dehalococcoidia bacterium]